MSQVIDKIREELFLHADEKAKLSALRYFKEEIKLYGLKTPDTSRIGRECYKELDDKGKQNVFSLCDELWKSGYIEESIIACDWSYNVHRQYEPEDFEVFSKWVHQYVSNWATCDTLCNHTVGTFIEMYPEYLHSLKKWAGSQNRWVRRASAVSLIVPARKGMFLKEILEIADILHADKDDMVRKGYGWMLKAASQAHQKEVFSYVMKMKSTMPRTSLRYAIEKMPVELKAMAMAK
jgi:3-methyladenine DNA glycosylase AlkD